MFGVIVVLDAGAIVAIVVLVVVFVAAVIVVAVVVAVVVALVVAVDQHIQTYMINQLLTNCYESKEISAALFVACMLHYFRKSVCGEQLDCWLHTFLWYMRLIMRLS